MFSPVTTNSSASKRAILIFLSSESVPKSAKTEKELYGYLWLHQENQGLASL